MQRTILIVIAAVAFFAPFRAEAGWMPNRFIVFFEPEPELDFIEGNDGIIHCGIPEIDMLMERYNVHNIEKFCPATENARIRQIRYPRRNYCLIYADIDSADIPAICDEFARHDNVICSAPDYLHPKLRTPNDPRYHVQWFLPKIDAPYIWNYSTGSNDVIVTVLEGTEWHHPDIYPNLWVNPGEDIDSDGVPFDPDDINGIDDDGNDKIDDFIGWDFIDTVDCECADGEDCHDEDNDPDDFDGHGTHTSGVIAAVGNNGIGVSGVCWEAKIVILRTDVEPAVGVGHHISSCVIKSIYYAIETIYPHIDVFSLSYGDYSYSAPERMAMEDLWDETDAIIFGAAGNDDLSDYSYPACYANVIAVAATDQYDIKGDFSNYGNWVDVSAPGVAIHSTIPDSDYTSWDGTSMACPVAAGVGALLRAVYPDSSNTWVRERVEQGTDYIYDVNPEYEEDSTLGTGRVNAFKAAFQWIFPYLELDTFLVYDSDDPDDRITQGEEGELVLYLHNAPDWQPADDITITASCNDSALIFIDNSIALGSVAPGDSGNNETEPIRFMMSADEPYGRPVQVKIEFESGSSDFLMDYTIEFMLGYSPILFYCCDETPGREVFIENSLIRGSVVYDIWKRSELGILDEELASSFFKTFLVFNAEDSTDILSSDEVELFQSLADDGKDLIFTGQFLPDFLAELYPDFIEDYFGMQHTSDSEPRVWGMQIKGVDGDPISIDSSLIWNAWSTADAAGNQISFGTCNPIGTGLGFLRYALDTDTTSYAAVHNELTSGAKTVMFEFGLEGVCNGAPGCTYRDTLVANIVRWMGFEYIPNAIDKPDVMEKPRKLRIITAPNPFNQAVNIAFVADGKYSVSIYDFTGRRVRSFPSGNAQETVTLIWNGTDDRGKSLPTGMYLVKVSSLDMNAVKKVILAR